VVVMVDSVVVMVGVVVVGAVLDFGSDLMIVVWLLVSWCHKVMGITVTGTTGTDT
jgi:hypothetical protein